MVIMAQHTAREAQTVAIGVQRFRTYCNTNLHFLSLGFKGLEQLPLGFKGIYFHVTCDIEDVRFVLETSVGHF